MTQRDISFACDSDSSALLEWNKQDTLWMLGLYGTAVGAGTLFLPINAGINGFLPLLIMMILVYPMTFLSHRALSRFVMTCAKDGDDITDVVKHSFGKKTGALLTFMYFFAIFPILLMYSVAITNTTDSFLVNQLSMTTIPRGWLSLGLLSLFLIVIRFGQSAIIRPMSFLVYPFIVALVLISLYLVPYWNSAIFYQEQSISGQPLIATIWLMIPAVIFSFNHSPIISSFSVQMRKQYGEHSDKKSSSILKNSQLLMIATVMFFVLSCVLSLTPSDLLLAKKQNISVLSYIANRFNTPVLACVAPLIAFVAISQSFLGHYLGAREGLQGLLFSEKSLKQSGWWLDIFIIGMCWMVAVMNPSILGMIETLGGPIIAIILFIMPIYAIYHIPALSQFRSTKIDFFVMTIGVMALLAIVYKLL